jgi:hypothetical protein
MLIESFVTRSFQRFGVSATPRTFVFAVRKEQAPILPRKPPRKVGFANSVCKYFPYYAIYPTLTTFNYFYHSSEESGSKSQSFLVGNVSSRRRHLAR